MFKNCHGGSLSNHAPGLEWLRMSQILRSNSRLFLRCILTSTGFGKGDKCRSPLAAFG